jgi:uncharacterized protein YqgV (UPF0045/DUF77 family)
MYKKMNASIDISYYPLHDEYIPPIKDFIQRLNQHENIVVNTNGMSTQVFGDYDQLMLILSAEIKKSFDLPHSVFILKIVNADLNHKDGSR